MEKEILKGIYENNYKTLTLAQRSSIEVVLGYEVNNQIAMIPFNMVDTEKLMADSNSNLGYVSNLENTDIWVFVFEDKRVRQVKADEQFTVLF